MMPVPVVEPSLAFFHVVKDQAISNQVIILDHLPLLSPIVLPDDPLI